MTDNEAKEIINNNPVIMAEIIVFWAWFQSLNKALKWLAFIGFPIALAIYGLIRIAKKE